MRVRCCCCGRWLVLYVPLKQEQQVFCDDCAIESDPAWRVGHGRGQCQSCMMFGTHWDDPKPVLNFSVCVR